MRYEISNYQHMTAMLAPTDADDLGLPWDSYPCILWDRGVGDHGYGYIDHQGVRSSPPRIAYERVWGPLSPKNKVSQRCGNILCFRPAHLFCRNPIIGLDYLKGELAALRDDLALPWSTYPCLLWKLGKVNGYGNLRVDGVSIRATRIAYMLAHPVALESRDFICHHCDTPACFRPSHLFLGSPADNSMDMAKKQRSVWGERGTRGKLTEKQVHEIRGLYAGGSLTMRGIGEYYGVSKTAIQYIVRGRNWGNLPHAQNQTCIE